MQKFTIYGLPKGKGRPRATAIPTATKKGYWVNMYTDNKTANYEAEVAASFYEQIGVISPTDKYVKMSITAIFAIPKSTTKKDREKMLSGQLFPDKKPDIDNIVKIILDGLNKILYKDDKQVVELSAKKIYGEEPCVIVEFEDF